MDSVVFETLDDDGVGSAMYQYYRSIHRVRNLVG
jgi:hypothetical protein